MLNLLELANPMSVIPYSSASLTAKSVGAAMLTTTGIWQKIAFLIVEAVCLQEVTRKLFDKSIPLLIASPMALSIAQCLLMSSTKISCSAQIPTTCVHPVLLCNMLFLLSISTESKTSLLASSFLDWHAKFVVADFPNLG
jgi:hypothetical protein